MKIAGAVVANQAATKSPSPTDDEGRISPELFKEELDNGNNMVAEFGQKVLVCAFEDGIAQKSFHTSRDTLRITGKQLIQLKKRTSTVLQQNSSDVGPGQDQHLTLTPQRTREIDTDGRAMLNSKSKSPSIENSASKVRNLKKFSSSQNTHGFQFPMKLQIANPEGSEYLEVQGEEIGGNTMKFRYEELNPQSPMARLQKSLKIRTNPLNEHKAYGRKIRQDYHLLPMHPKQINLNHQTGMPETPQPIRQQITNNFPQRSIKRNSIVKIVNQIEEPAMQSMQKVTVNKLRRSTMSPGQASTDLLTSLAQSADKSPIQDLNSTANNSEQHIKPSFHDVKQAVPAFVGSREKLSPIAVQGSTSNADRARTSPFQAQGQQPQNEGQNIGSPIKKAINNNDTKLMKVDSMVEGSVASADTFCMLTANFASTKKQRKLSGNRQTMALDRTEVEQFLYPGIAEDSKFAQEVAQMDVQNIFQHQPQQSHPQPALQQLQQYMYNPSPSLFQKRVLIEQFTNLGVKLDIQSMKLQKDRRYPPRNYQRVIATQTNGPQQNDRDQIKSPASQQSSAHQDHLRHTFINSKNKENKEENKDDQGKSLQKATDLTVSGIEDHSPLTLTFQDTLKRPRPNQKIKTAKEIVSRSISVVMKESDLEVKIHFHTSHYPNIKDGQDIIDRHSTQLVEPNERDSIEGRGSQRGDPATQTVTMATLPSDGSQPENIHPIMETREQEQSKYTLKPMSCSSTNNNSTRQSKALPSIRKIAAKVQDSSRSPMRKTNRAVLFNEAPTSVIQQSQRANERNPERSQFMKKQLQSLQTKSKYTADPNRCKYLFTNLRRLALINDPISRLSECQKQQLPEDKSFMAMQKNCLPSKFKSQNLRNKHFYHTTIDMQQSGQFALPTSLNQGMSSRRWDTRGRAHSISRKVGDITQLNTTSVAETIRSSRGFTKNNPASDNGSRGRISPHGGDQHKSQLPAVASKFQEWLHDSQNRELELGMQQPVTLDTAAGQYQRKLRQNNKLTGQQKRRMDYFEMSQGSDEKDNMHGGGYVAKGRANLVSQQLPMPQLANTEYVKPYCKAGSSVDSIKSKDGHTTVIDLTNKAEERLNTDHMNEEIPMSIGQEEDMSEVRSSVGGIPSHLMAFLKNTGKSKRGETPGQQACQLQRALRGVLPEANRLLMSGQRDRDAQAGGRLTIADIKVDTPMTQICVAGASSLKSKITPGQNDSQASIVAGQVLLGASEELSAENKDHPERNSQRKSAQMFSLNAREYKNLRSSTQTIGKKATVLSKQKKTKQSRLSESSRPALTHPLEPIPDQNLLNMQDISTLKRVNVGTDITQPLLFQLMTLYSAQIRQWNKYDDEWALFELDHLTFLAPIPPSAQFLIVHLLQREKHRVKRLATQQQQQQDQLLDNSIDSIMSSSFEDPVAVLDGSQLKEPSMITVEQIPLTLIDEIYKESRMRLQMCQSSLLIKFNDDQKVIFNVLKTELEETYGRLKQTASFIAP